MRRNIDIMMLYEYILEYIPDRELLMKEKRIIQSFLPTRFNISSIKHDCSLLAAVK